MGMKDREMFALRVLLNNTKGAMSFEHLKTLDDSSICNTLMAACIAKNLVSDDQYISDCMSEQAHHGTNINQLRQLFIDLLFECEVVNPVKLYEVFKDEMKVDYVYQYKKYFRGKTIPQPPANDNEEEDKAWNIDRIAMNSVVCALEKLCNEKGDNRNKSLKDFDANV